MEARRRSNFPPDGVTQENLFGYCVHKRDALNSLGLVELAVFVIKVLLRYLLVALETGGGGRRICLVSVWYVMMYLDKKVYL